jgi:hypothetical protein
MTISSAVFGALLVDNSAIEKETSHRLNGRIGEHVSAISLLIGAWEKAEWPAFCARDVGDDRARRSERLRRGHIRVETYTVVVNHWQARLAVRCSHVTGQGIRASGAKRTSRSPFVVGTAAGSQERE